MFFCAICSKCLLHFFSWGNKVGKKIQPAFFKKKNNPKIFEDNDTNLVNIIRREMIIIIRIHIVGHIVVHQTTVLGKFINYYLLIKKSTCFNNFYKHANILKIKLIIRAQRNNHQKVNPQVSYNSNTFQPKAKNQRPSMSIDQINENIRLSQEPRPRNNLQKTSENSRQSLPDLKIYNLENQEILKKEISLETVENLLSQKHFVKQIMGRNPNFLKIVTEEVKEKIQKELRGKL